MVSAYFSKNWPLCQFKRFLGRLESDDGTRQRAYPRRGVQYEINFVGLACDLSSRKYLGRVGRRNAASALELRLRSDLRASSGNVVLGSNLGKRQGGQISEEVDRP